MQSFLAGSSAYILFQFLRVFLHVNLCRHPATKSLWGLSGGFPYSCPIMFFIEEISTMNRTKVSLWQEFVQLTRGSVPLSGSAEIHQGGLFYNVQGTWRVLLLASPTYKLFQFLQSLCIVISTTYSSISSATTSATCELDGDMTGNPFIA